MMLAAKSKLETLIEVRAFDSRVFFLDMEAVWDFDGLGSLICMGKDSCVFLVRWAMPVGSE